MFAAFMFTNPVELYCIATIKIYFNIVFLTLRSLSTNTKFTEWLMKHASKVNAHFKRAEVLKPVREIIKYIL